MYSISPILQKPGRIALTVTAIALAIALSVTLLSFGEGVRSGYGQILEERGTDIFVGGVGSNLFLSSLNIFENGTNISEDIEEMGGVREAVPLLYGYHPFYIVTETAWLEGNGSAAQDGQLSLYGVVAGASANFVGEDRGLLNGNGLETMGDPHYNEGRYDGPFTGELVISSKLASILGVVMGDTVYTNSFLPPDMTPWLENATPLTITAVRDLEGRRAVMHLSELQDLCGLENGDVSEIRVDIEDPERAEILAASIEMEHPVAAFTVDDILGESERFLSSFKELANLLSAVAICVAAIFTSTIMIIATHERKKELGLLRALGFKSSTILGHIMSQALFLTLAGCLLGLFLGFIGVSAVESVLTSQFSGDLPPYFAFSQVTPRIIAASLFVAFLVALIAGLMAYRQTMKIKVVEVLHGD